jgi:hypothetical protein
VLTKVRLTKPWGPYKSGEVLEVDPIRAGRLILEEAAVPYMAGVVPEPVSEVLRRHHEGK